MLAEVGLFQAVCRRMCLCTIKGIRLRDFLMLQAIAKLGKEKKSSLAAEGPRIRNHRMI